MTGPDHYREGERLLTESEATSVSFSADKAHVLATQANAHFLAALTASHATAHHPDSVAWKQAINPEQT